MNNRRSPNSIEFRSPLWVLVDDNPDPEIFNRIAAFLQHKEVPDAQQHFDAIKAKEGKVYELPWFGVAWSRGDSNQLKELLTGCGRKALIQMDVNFSDAGKGAQYGLELTRELRAEEAIGEHSVFLFKTRTEAAFADSYRRSHINHLRISRSLSGSGATERIQFLAANNNDFDDLETEDESQRVSELILALQEELFLDTLRDRYLDRSACSGLLDLFDARNYFGAFLNQPSLARRYVSQFLRVACDDTTVPNSEGGPLPLGQIEALRMNDRTRNVKKLFIGEGAEKHALELALLRFGSVALVEGPLFFLAGLKKGGDGREISKMDSEKLPQKWRPVSFGHRLSVLEFHEIEFALDALEEVVESSSPTILPAFRKLRQRFTPELLTGSTLLDSTVDFVELRAFLKDNLSAIALGMVEDALGQLERAFRLDHGLRILPVEIDTISGSSGDPQTRKKKRLSKTKKVHVLFNRNQIKHNLVSAAVQFEESGESRHEQVIRSLILDPQCPEALSHLAKLAEADADEFAALVKRIEATRVKIGLPQAGNIYQLFQPLGDGSGLKNVSFFLEDKSGYEVSLLELVAGGLMVLRYHIESYLRLMQWTDDKSLWTDDIRHTLAVLWRQRGWQNLFKPEIPEGIDDPLDHAWAEKVNLMERLGEVSEVADQSHLFWSAFLKKWEIQSVRGGKSSAYAQGLPPSWLRLFWLGLPSVYHECFEREVSTRSIDERPGDSGDLADNESNDVVDNTPDGFTVVDKHFGGEPLSAHKKLSGLLETHEINYTIKIPTNPDDWTADSQFLRDIEEAWRRIVKEM